MSEFKMPQVKKVKNKVAADVQITAEQILREAFERQDSQFKEPKYEISDWDELNEYRLTKRKDFEDQIRRERYNISTWLRYAKWEEKQDELKRARSVYERALEVEDRNELIYIKYAEMEMRCKNINHARNLWDRAISLLPRVSQFWYKYIHMEDMLGNYDKVRNLYERWMEWSPDEHAWTAYIKFELRNGETELVRKIFRRYVLNNNAVKSYIKWAKFEENHDEPDNAREVYQNAFENLGEDAHDEQLFIEFSSFEERSKEYDRARTIYKFALDNLPKNSAKQLYKRFIQFEKKYGDKKDIEHVILNKRRFQYEDELKINPLNYDLWFDYIRLEESSGNKERIRDVYERAISNIPPGMAKRHWKRYIYLWISYALYEEVNAKDFDRARQIWMTCLSHIPHQHFSFSKVWIHYAKFEVRRMDLNKARKVFGNAIGKSPSEKIFRAYIDLELHVADIDRCRTIYQKFLEWAPENCNAWISFAELERSLDDLDRVKAIYEIAVDQPELDKPELLWKSYIDFEDERGEHDNVRNLYERLLERSQHPKIWTAYSQFEESVGNHDKAKELSDKARKALEPEEKIEENKLSLKLLEAADRKSVV